MKQPQKSKLKPNKASKTDKYAKYAFCKFLKKDGYTNIKVINTPVDIKAEKENVIWWFEIKKTSTDGKYFGATTLTELEKANECVNGTDQFRFVIAQEVNAKENLYNFTLLTLDEFAQTDVFHPSIPPIKIYFNVDLANLNLGKKYEGEAYRISNIDKDADYQKCCKLSRQEKNEIRDNKKDSISFDIADIDTMSAFMENMRKNKKK